MTIDPNTLLIGAGVSLIGFLFQFHYLLPDFNAIENVLLPLRISGHFNENSDNEAKELLSQLGLSERFGHHPQELSGGEQQRVSLARALIRKPKLLLCDEPTGNLDQKTAQGVANLIFEQTRQLKTSVVLVTHNQDLAHKTDKIFQLQDGRFIG
jgi:lipoprotein-releasing system ATP-binding protein